MLKKFFVMGTFAGLLAFAPNASATLQLNLISGPDNILINDCVGTNAACAPTGDFNGAAGQITYIGAVGNWILNVTTGTLGVNPIIDLNSVDTVSGNGTGANTLTLKFSANNLVGPTQGFTSSIGGTLAAGTTLTYQGYVDGTNTIFGTGTPIGALQTFGPGGNFGGGVTGGPLGASLYSATEQVVLSATTNGTSSFNAAIDVVPEPTGVLMLGGVLLLTAGALRRKIGRRA